MTTSRAYRTPEGHFLMSEPTFRPEWDHDRQDYVSRAYTETVTNPANGKSKQMPLGWCEEAAQAGYLTEVSHGYAFQILIPAA